MPDHGHFGQRGQLMGQAGAANFQFSMRWMGRVASSGRRQIVISCWDWPTAAEVFHIVYRWWTRVPTNVHREGWRMVPCRWMQR